MTTQHTQMESNLHLSVKQSKNMYTLISTINNSTLLQTTWTIFVLEGGVGGGLNKSILCISQSLKDILNKCTLISKAFMAPLLNAISTFDC